jgi:hypothetical protein
MNKTLSTFLLLLAVYGALGQAIGTVNKKTKEFTVPPNQKMDYQVFGYQFANITTQKMICFSSHEGDVRANYSRCPLGSYFDTEKLKLGDKIIYLGSMGPFGKMNFISGTGQKTIFYLPKSSFKIK